MKWTFRRGKTASRRHSLAKNPKILKNFPFFLRYFLSILFFESGGGIFKIPLNFT